VASHLLLVEEAKNKQRDVSYAEGFAAGRAEGKREYEESVTIALDWSPAKDVIDRMYSDENPEPQRVQQASEQILAKAHQWDRFSKSEMWQDIDKALTDDLRRRLQQLVAGEGDADLNRTMIKFIEELVNMPKAVAKAAERLNRADELLNQGEQ